LQGKIIDVHDPDEFIDKHFVQLQTSVILDDHHQQLTDRAKVVWAEPSIAATLYDNGLLSRDAINALRVTI
jgi:hypothetical protein